MNYQNSKYFTTLSKKKIKYLYIKGANKITVVFFHGFMSNMVGLKPAAIQKFCRKKKLSFLKFEYSGHGKSSGKFINGNITQWTNEAKQLIKSKNKINNNLVFVGSSMGSWIALNLMPSFKNKIKGFLGIASAPEFLEELMWKKFSKKIKSEIMIKKIYYLKHANFTYPLTKQLIIDGRKNKFFSKKNIVQIPVTLFHGKKDKVVPLAYSKKILKKFGNVKKRFVKIKNGDHSLSRKNDLKKICKELNYLIFN
jgi:uncharacterized protein